MQRAKCAKESYVQTHVHSTPFSPPISCRCRMLEKKTHKLLLEHTHICKEETVSCTDATQKGNRQNEESKPKRRRRRTTCIQPLAFDGERWTLKTHTETHEPHEKKTNAAVANHRRP